MNTQDAVTHVLAERKITKYRLAMELGCDPTSVNQWLRNTKMSEHYKKVFHNLYGIEIDDTL